MGALVAVAAPAVSHAAVPPDPHDPCARAGRDTCRTTGVGVYRVYRYGLRWFGDFRNAVPGEQHTFCLDLRFWYASRSYRYRPAPASSLRNRAGAPVPAERRHRLAYAIWRFGRSSSRAQQAAVMLYVHSLMGDARPGELDPAAVGPRVAALFRRVARDSARDHGPYRIEARLPRTLTVGRPATAAVRVLSARGHPLAHVDLTLAVDGASGVPTRVRTDGAGVARVRLTPTAASGLRLRIRTAALASTEPRVFAPTAGAARANGQRLAAPSSQRVSSTVARDDVVAAPRIATRASTQRAAPGETVTDAVTVSGLGGASVPVRVELWGPYARRSEISCAGTPYWSGAFVAAGDGTTTTAPVRLERAGYYVYRESIAASPSSTGFATPCGSASETTLVVARPALATAVSVELMRRGGSLSDRIRVSGLGTTPARIEVELYGPFASREAIRCSARRLVWKGRVTARGSGEVRTPPVRLRRPGFYGYRERLLGTPLVAGATTACAPRAETSLVAPRIVTGRGDVASFTAAPGADARRPVRIRIRSLGIDAPVTASGIDLAHGVLGIPGDIHRAGWWRDGQAPGAQAGAILIAGHVDSAAAGEGAFFSLHRVRRNARVALRTASGHVVAYRVVAVRSYPKSALPIDVFSSTGRPRLVLVTCGGRFDEASGHYPDDVVVTAVPVG